MIELFHALPHWFASAKITWTNLCFDTGFCQYRSIFSPWSWFMFQAMSLSCLWHFPKKTGCAVIVLHGKLRDAYFVNNCLIPKSITFFTFLCECNTLWRVSFRQSMCGGISNLLVWRQLMCHRISDSEEQYNLPLAMYSNMHCSITIAMWFIACLCNMLTIMWWASPLARKTYVWAEASSRPLLSLIFYCYFFMFYTPFWAEPSIHSPRAGLASSGAHSSNELREKPLRHQLIHSVVDC